MSNIKLTRKTEFDNIIQLIEQARTRAFSRVNAELVLLYFNVGQIVSSKVADRIWGEATVDELANYITRKIPGLGGFNRRGLYRMKQFYETYSVNQFVSPLVTQMEAYFSLNKESVKVSAAPTQIQIKKAESKSIKVSAVRTQLKELDLLKEKFMSTVLTQVQWSNHLEILSQTKSPEEKFFYLLHCIKERWTMRELRRQLTTGYFERTMISSKTVSAPAFLPLLNK